MSLNLDFAAVLKDTLASLKRVVSAPVCEQTGTGRAEKNDRNQGHKEKAGPVGRFLQGIKRKEDTITAAVFRQWLQPLKESLYNFIYKALNYSEDADDLFQETVMRALKYIDSFDRGSSFKTWIFTIAHNEIKSYYKKKKGKTGNIISTLHRVEDLERGIPADEKSTERQLIADIYEIAAGFKPKQRKVFFLFYDSRFSIAEISRITGLKEGNIKFILNRARKKIKENFGLAVQGTDNGQPLRAESSSLNKSFAGGVKGGQFFKRAPPCRRRQEGEKE